MMVVEKAVVKVGLLMVLEEETVLTLALVDTEEATLAVEVLAPIGEVLSMVEAEELVLY